MSSWEPAEEEEENKSTHDPGVHEREIIKGRDFSEAVYNFDSIDYLLFGLLASIPAGFLTTILMLEFYPDYQDTAGEIVQEIFDIIIPNVMILLC